MPAMVERLLRKSRNSYIRFIFGAVCLVVIAGITYFPNYSKLKKLRNENKRLVSENEDLVIEIDDLEKKLEIVGEDSFLYEKIAREDLGVARENEIVIDIKD